jgi:uncharacterized protein YbjT (DUF2867 family)
MAAYKTSKIFVVGGTGAQGIPVIRGLVEDRKYSCRVLTRDTNSARAKHLLALGNVEFVTGTFASEKDLREGLRGCDGAFINVSPSSLHQLSENRVRSVVISTLSWMVVPSELRASSPHHYRPTSSFARSTSLYWD